MVPNVEIRSYNTLGWQAGSFLGAAPPPASKHLGAKREPFQLKKIL